MNNFARVGFPVAFAASVIATFTFFSNPALIALTWVMGGYALSALLAAFHPGDKTRLQCMFLAVGAALATCTVALAWGWGGWVAVGICAFLVLTMKLDGGDGYGA